MAERSVKYVKNSNWKEVPGMLENETIDLAITESGTTTIIEFRGNLNAKLMETLRELESKAEVISGQDPGQITLYFDSDNLSTESLFQKIEEIMPVEMV